MSQYPTPDQLLPHTGRAVLLDEVVGDHGDRTHVRAHITSSHPYFVPDRGVPAWAGIEMMAQMVAVHAGLVGRREGRGPREGMLLGTRRYQGRVAWFEEGTCLDIHGQMAFSGAGGMGACDSRIECAGEVLAEATIIIMEREAA